MGQRIERLFALYAPGRPHMEGLRPIGLEGLSGPYSAVSWLSWRTRLVLKIPRAGSLAESREALQVGLAAHLCATDELLNRRKIH
jgi:hypothetical protein